MNWKSYVLAGLMFFVSVNANLIQSMYEVVEEYLPSKYFEEEVTRYDRRYGILKAMVPPDEVVGYLTDEEFGPRIYNLTQYAMCPVFLTYDIKPRFVITNFTEFDRAEQRIRYAEANGLKLVKKVDQAVMLFRRDAK